MKRSYTILLCVVIAVLSAPLSASRMLVGSLKEHEKGTFEVPMRAFHISREAIFAGAAQEGAQGYALSVFKRELGGFVALMPETVAGESEDKPLPNPLYNKEISLISSLVTKDSYNRPVDHPLVVLSCEPASLYLLEHYNTMKYLTLYTTSPLLDASGKPASKITALAASDRVAFAVLKNSAGDPFGMPGSGIAMAVRTDAHIEKKGKLQSQINIKQIATMPLDVSSPYIKIGHDLSSIGEVVDMHWDQRLERLYIALHVTAGNDAQAGAHAVVVAAVASSMNKIENEKSKFDTKYMISLNGMIIMPFVSQAAFTKDNHIVGAMGAQAHVSMHKVRTMHTTTALSYLIALGGNGAPADTRRAVYALPLLNTVAQESEQYLLGTLAAKDSHAHDYFTTGSVARFSHRVFDKRAASCADLFTNDLHDPANRAAIVGGGSLCAGDIADIFVEDDAVYAIVRAADDGQLPGIFSSQALFDHEGRIKAWTPWQRVAGVTQAVSGARLEAHMGDFTMLMRDSDDLIRVACKTEWKKIDTEKNTIRRAFMEPTHNDLNSLGAIHCVEQTPWGLFVGGDLGLCAMERTRGATMQEVIGQYHFVRKLIYDEGFLYVLTDTCFDRIDLATAGFPATRIAAISDLATDARVAFNMALYDCVVSGPFAVLATRMGLFRVGDGADVRHASDAKAARWTLVSLPNGYRATTSLYAVTATGNEKDVARGAGGNLYIVSSDIDTQYSRIHRLSIAGLDESDLVSAATMQLIPHIRVKGIPSFFRQCNGLAQTFITDGAVFWYTQGRQLTKKPMLRSVKTDSQKSDTNILVDIDDAAASITRVMRNAATGSWLLVGDSISVNE